MVFYGLLKSFVQKSSGQPELEKSGFHYYKTNAYKLHYFETPTNFKFVLTTDPDVGDMREAIRNIYKNIFVEYVVKNPLYKMNDQIKCELFVENFQKEIKSLAAFRTAPKVITTSH